MDAQIDAQLQEQEDGLRAVLTLLAQAHHEVRQLQGATGWRGLAGSAYEAALAVLETRLAVAEDRVRQALRDTADAIMTRGCCG